MHGRRGQAQDGVDIFGVTHLGQIGVQCKNTFNGVKKKIINDEIIKANKFDPPLKALYIATSADRDTTIQKEVRKISESRVTSGLFSVDILFWEDICQDLILAPDVFLKHYPQFANNQPPVLAVGVKLTKLHEVITTIFHDIRAVFPFYATRRPPQQLRIEVKSIHEDIGKLSLIIKNIEMELPQSLYDVLYKLLGNISSTVNSYLGPLNVYDDHELVEIEQLRFEAWNNAETLMNDYESNIKPQIKVLIQKNQNSA
jgi:hypothetical protein